jgi:hypothetical protein
MRSWLILAPIALVGSPFVLSAQTTRPAPTVIRPMPQPQVANPTGGAGRTEAMIAELQRQIDAANSKIAAQANTIESMKNQIQQIAIGGFANKGDVSALAARVTVLRSDYDRHTHFSYYEHEELGKNLIKSIFTSCPTANLQTNPNPKSPSVREQKICNPQPK